MDILGNKIVLLLFGSVLVFCMTSEGHTLQDVVDELTQTVGSLQLRVEALETAAGKKAAFRGIRLVDATAIPDQAPIKFIESNNRAGEGYNLAEGVYTAPFSGWYTINARLYLKLPGTFWLDVIKNGPSVSRVHCHSATHNYSCSSGVTLHVQAGDRLWLEARTYHGDCYNADFDNVFSIVLVSLD